ncbi:MAG: DMT family transporter [Pseudonocardia sp.]|nr:DMT family transporter [Pseudonocardia sp.]
MTGDQPLVAALAALSGAAATALGTALQQRATHTTPRGQLMLARQPSWLAGLGLVAVGFGGYLAALSMGSLAYVQPIMISGLPLGSVFTAWLARRRPDTRLVGGAAICGVGLALLLAAARPVSPPPSQHPATAAEVLEWLVFPLGAALLAACLVAARGRGMARALGCAVASGLLFGVNAALTKLVVGQLAHGWAEPFRHWPDYAIIILAPAGFLLSQRAMRLSRFLAPVNALISTVDPVTAVAIGLVAFHERVTVTGLALCLEAIAVLLLLAGITVITRRGARLHKAHLAGGERAALGWG